MNGGAVVIDAGAEPQDPFEFLLGVTRRHGDAVQYQSSVGCTYLFNHPDHIKHVLQSPQFQRTTLVTLVLGEGLLASDGEHWRQQRGLAQPFFRQDRLSSFGPLIEMHTRAMIARWSDVADTGQPMDISVEMTRLTLSIIIDALFGVKLSNIDELCRAIQVLMEDLGAMACTQLNKPLSFSPHSNDRFRRALTSVDRTVEVIIEQRRRMPPDPANFLSFLLSHRNEGTGAALTDRQIRDEVVTLMISGHETTSLILSWAWALLAQHPAAERTLHDELDRALGNRPPALEDLKHLAYSLMVLQESMRLYPPVWFIARKSVFAGDIKGCHVPGNMAVIVSPYAIHRHPGFWEEPDAFNPLRFEQISSRPKFSYIPFGGGHHQCLGMHLALVEAQLILASVAREFKIQPLAGHAIVPQPAITLRQRDGLLATLARRRKGG